MKKAKLWKRMLAFILAFTMIVQSSVSVGAGTVDGAEEASTTESKQETETTSWDVTAKVVQELLVKSDQNYVKYIVSVKNNSTENAAKGVNIKALVPDLITYDKTYGNTGGLKVFENQSTLEAGYDLDEIDKNTLHDYEAGQVFLWSDLTLAVGEEKEFVVYGSVELGAKNIQDLDSVWYVAGEETNTSWENASSLIVDPIAVAKRNQSSTTEGTTKAQESDTKEASTTEGEKKTDSSEGNVLQSAVQKVTRAITNFLGAGQAREAETTSNKLSDYITKVTLKANSSDDSPIYDADNPAYDNGWFFLKLEFAEKENLQFPVYDAKNAAATTLTYQIPEGIKGFDAVGPTNIVKTGTTEVYGTYEISESGLISIKFNEKVLTYTNCSSYLVFQAQFDRDKINGKEEYIFNFEGTEGVKIKFNHGGALSGSKTASEYNPETGTFTFTITIDAADPLTNVIVKDKMGENLILLKDSVKLDGTPISVTETTDGFTVTFETLSKGTHRLTYEASIDRDAMLSYNGTPIPGLENSATLDADGQTTVPVKGDAEHSHQWLAKSNSGVDENTKKVTWNVTLYTDGLTNLTIHDKLPSSGLNYDRSTPISVSPSINGKNTLSWDEVEVGSDGKSWSYTLEVEDPAESYTFSYQTTVESDAKGKLSNTVTVDGNFPTKSEVDLGEGIGTGEGTGTVDKTVDEVVTEGSTKYVPWESTIHLSAGNHTNVIYTDTLYGTHKFADDLSLTASNQYSKITVMASGGSTLTPTLTVSDDKKSFVLDFGDLNLKNDTDITISYYSVVEKNGNLSNVGDLNADGAASSDSENTTVVDQNFSKTGVYDENTGLITWRIYLNKKGNTLTGYMRVEDTFSSNQELVPYEGSPYWGAKALLYYNGVPQGAYPEVDGNKLTLNFNPNTDQELYLEYQTKLKDDVSRDEAVAANNEAKIYVNNQEVGNVDQDVVIPSNLFDKKLIGSDPSKENNYQAQFQINVNESGIKLCPDGTVSDDYVIEDTLSANMSLDVSSIRVYQKVGNSWNQLSRTESNNAYYKVDLTNDNHKIVITIKNPETTDNRTYKIEYSAQIQTGSGMGTVDWDNAASFRAGSTYKTDTEEGTVKKEQSSDSGITGSHLYIEVYKYDAVTVTAMPGVTFNVYELNADGTKNGAAVASGTTNSEGKLILGQDPTASVATGYAFKENQRYMLEEVTPEGYLANDPVYFQIGDKIDDSKYTVHRIGDTFNIANMPKVSLTVSKDWLDSNNQDGTRPESIQVQLYANGTVSGNPITLNKNNNWTYTWNDLPKKNDAGLITYTVDEVSVPDGYTKSVTKDNENSTEAAIKYTIKNTYKPQVTTKTVTKQWNDSNNQDGIRPQNITLELQYKAGESGTYKAIDGDFLATYSKEGSKIQYQLNGTGNWTDVTSATVTLSGDASAAFWSCKWRNLPKKIDGQTVSYEVKETSTLPTGYTVDNELAGSDNKIVNSHTTEKISKTVTKYWADSVGTDDNGNRPSKATVQLKQSYTGGTPVDYGAAVELSSANNWTYTWPELPKYIRVNNQSYEVIYTIVETTVPQYETTYYNNGSATGDAVASGGTTGSSVSIKNSYKPEKISVEAQKVWKDNSNADNLRPESITLALEKSSDNKKWTEVSTKAISKNTDDSQNNQSWTEKAVWNDLLKYENGQKVYYRVVEKNGPSGYTISYNVNSFDATTITTGGKQDIVVTNTHGAKATVSFSAKKVLEGNRSQALQPGEFTFAIKDAGGDLVQTATNDSAGNVTFSPALEFTREGTFNYTVSEVKGADSNITYSGEVYNVSVEVKMNDAGQLVATPTITKNGNTVEGFSKVTFTNTYKASGSGSISGTKTLVGKALTEGEFTFGLFESADGTTPVATATNAANGTFTITTPTYYQNDIGTTKTYYLKEIADSSKSDIYDYDSTVYTVEVAISDAGNGNLNIVPVIKKGESTVSTPSFRNDYKASGSLTLTATKTVTGRPDVPSQFTFELYKLDSATSAPSGTPLQTVTNNGAGISFTPLTYQTSDIGKTYYYAVKEKTGTNSAYTYDSVIYIVKAEVKHGDTAGSIKVDTTYYIGSVADNNKVNTITFKNDYKANGEITLTGKKNLSGKDLSANQFSFILYKVTNKGTASEQEHQIGSVVKNGADGTIIFPTLTYTQADIGTHYYRIRETNAGNGAYAYADPVDVTITVNASNTGTLQVVANKNGAGEPGREGIVFNNTYTASVDVGLVAKKVLNGRTLANNQFTFTLTGDGQDGNNVSQTKTNNGNGMITFDKLSFTQDDIGKTYRYTLKEEIPSPEASGYTYDKTEHQVAIAITDENDNGTLTATVTVDGKAYDAENPPTFTNNYEASGKITLGGTKSITGKTLEAGEFSFILTDKSGKQLDTATNLADGSFTFGELTYNQDQVGDHVYLIKEDIPNPKQSGYTYDETGFRVTVHVSDNGDGSLSAAITQILAERAGQDPVDSTVSGVVFTNIYNAKGTAIISAKKALEGRALEADQFTFKLYDSDGRTELQTKKNDAAGTVTFDPISYTETQLGDHIYYIKEVSDGADGYTYSKDVYRVTVTVEDKNHDGSLTTSVAYEKQNGAAYETATAAVFTNIYKAKGSITVSGTKTLTGNKALQDQQFNFILTDKDGKEISKVSNNANGNFSFPALTYNQNDLEGVGEDGKDFTYYVKEEKPENADQDPYDYDNTIYKVVIRVVDNKDGTLGVTLKSLTVNEEAKEKITFTNHYNAEGSLDLSVQKQTNIPLKDLQDKVFSFKLSGSGENQTANSDKVTGKAVFQTITYDEDDINQTYFYTISEIRAKNAGYEYSNEIYLIRVTITDNGDGTLKVDSKITNSMSEEVKADEMVFVNTYSAEGSLALEAQKTLNGRALEDGQFTFELYDSDGTTVLQTKKNNEEGKVTFDQIPYDQDDIGKEFTYTVKEKNTADAGYTYSEEIYTVKVSVADGGNGKLLVTSTITNQANESVPSMEFVNTYAAEGKISLKAQKTLDDDVIIQTIEAGDYSFQVTENGKVVATGINDAEGKVIFSEIVYNINGDDQTALGEHTYEIREVEGTDKTTLYDDTVYTLKVNVTDNGDGTLKAEVTSVVKGKENMDGMDDVQFVNDFTKFRISKKAIDASESEELEGATLHIEDEDGNVVVGPWESAKEAKYVEGVLKAGEIYYLVETAAPAGYVIAEKVEFTVKATGEIQKVEMKDDTTKVHITKTDITGEKELPGATLQVIKQIKNDDGSEIKEEIIEEWVSTEKAHTIEGKLTAGETYLLREITAPNGYAIANDITFTVSEDGSVDTVVMKDEATKAVISKEGITEEEELPGATLQVIKQTKDDEGNVTEEEIIEEWVSTEEAHIIEGKLIGGEEYILREITSPDGYTVANDVTFTVTDRVDENGNLIVDKVKMVDEQTRISFKKTNITGEEELEGATLQILDEAGNVVEEWISGKEAHVIMGKLNVGSTYTLKEIAPPDGYAYTADITFKVKKDGTVDVAEENKDQNGAILMKDEATKASILKTDKDGNGLAGATLAIKDGETNEIVEQWVTTKEAYDITGKLVVGKEYYLTEIALPSGYQWAKDISFTVPEDGIVSLTMVDEELSKSVGSISVTKKIAAIDGVELVDLIAEDATYYVGLFTDEAGKHPYGDDYVREIRIQKASVSAPVEYTNLPSGTYYILETDKDGNPIALNEEQKGTDGSSYICTVEENSTNQVELDLNTAKGKGEVTLVNAYYNLPEGYSLKANIDILKEVLKDGSSVTVEDTFYAGIFTKDASGNYNLYKVVQLEQNGTVTVEVPLGGAEGTEPITYYVFETDQAGNRVTEDNFIYDVSGEGEVTVSKDNNYGSLTITNTVPADVYELKIQKVDESGNGLAGAKFEMTSEDGDVVASWTTEKGVKTLEVLPGTYTLEEMEAPDGYKLGGEVTIEVGEDGSITVTGDDAKYENRIVKYINKKDTTTSGDDSNGGSKNSSGSKTGDTTNMELYMLLMAAALLGGILTFRRRKKVK